MKEMLPDTDDGTHVVKFNEYVHGPGSEDPMSPSENPYSRLGDLEPANLISFAYQIAAGMVRASPHVSFSACLCICINVEYIGVGLFHLYTCMSSSMQSYVHECMNTVCMYETKHKH